ncbi:MAG: MFS transporter [Paludibacteraceae bacterium]|nr:MFS transporter [Paludibacteraceae bacterium]
MNKIYSAAELRLAKNHARYALMTMYFFAGFTFATLFSRMPALKIIYDFNFTGLGLMELSMSIGGLLIMPVCSNLANRYGSKNMTLMGFIVATLFALIPIMPSKYLLYPVCVGYGMFVSLFDIAINGNSILVEKAYKRSILSKFHAIYYVGTLTGALVAITFLTFDIPTWAHFATASGCVYAELILLRRFLIRERPKKNAEDKKFRLLFPKGILLLIAFFALFSRVIEGVVSTWSTTYMNEVITLPQNLAPLGLAAYAAFMSIGRFLGDIVRNRFSETFILVVCSGIACLGLAMFASAASFGDAAFAISVIALFITGIGMSCVVPIVYSQAGSQPDISPGAGIAMVNTISGTGFLFGPFLIANIADAFGLRVSFVYVWTLSIAMGVLATILWRRNGMPKGK